MSQNTWKSPQLGVDEDNQDANLAFTLVACNERARQMWVDPHNKPRYVPASFTRDQIGDGFLRAETSAITMSGQLREKKDTEPALQFLFNIRPKDLAKGYVLGSYDKSCDALLSDPGDGIPEEMLAFTYNRQHQLVMNVTSDHQTSVTFGHQKQGNRKRFSWIFPHGNHKIRVKVANGIEFDVVLPQYGRNVTEFYKNCDQFLSSDTGDNLLANSLDIGTKSVATDKNETSKRLEPFYFRVGKLGSGSYGSVFKALQMPSGKSFAAKTFDNNRYFRKEVEMLRKVCETNHENIVQFEGEWCEDFEPILIMEYIAGGDLRKQIEDGMGYGEIANLANQGLSGLVFLHDRNVMHRDLKPENILCAGPNQYKLADFGLSKEVASSASRKGSDLYMAPEVDRSGLYDCKADIWSYGAVLSECMNGLPEGRPKPGQVRRWCRKVRRNCKKYFTQCRQLPEMSISTFFALVLLVKDSMLVMNPEGRWPARLCLENVPELWETIFQEEDFDAGSGATAPTQAHQKERFKLNQLKSSKPDEEDEETVLIFSD